MIIVLKKGTAQKDIDSLTQMLTDEGVQVNPVIGTDITILGLVGDTTQVDPNRVESYDCVDRIMHVAEPSRRGQGHSGAAHLRGAWDSPGFYGRHSSPCHQGADPDRTEGQGLHRRG